MVAAERARLVLVGLASGESDCTLMEDKTLDWNSNVEDKCIYSAQSGDDTCY